MSVNGQTCTFTTGGTTVSAYCEAGCCTDACCGESVVTAETIAIITCSTIGGLVILLLLALLIYCCMRRRGWCQDKGDEERARPKKAKRPKEQKQPKVEPKKDWNKLSKKIVKNKPEENIRTVINGKWDWHGWKKQAYGEDCKGTQTGKFKLLPGDVSLPAKSRWFPVMKNKDFVDKRVNIRDIGVGTDQVENYKIPKKVKETHTKISAVEAFKAAKVTTLPVPKEVRPADDRGVSPSMVKPYQEVKQSSAKHSDDGYQSKGKSSASSPEYGNRQDTSDSLTAFTNGVFSEANKRGDIESPFDDPGRDERDRLALQQVKGYTATWQYPEVKRWNPHSSDKKGGPSKWDKAHNYAKNLNTN